VRSTVSKTADLRDELLCYPLAQGRDYRSLSFPSLHLEPGLCDRRSMLMARTLISEPNEVVRRLLEGMLRRLGHEPLLITMPTLALGLDADLFIVEPKAAGGSILTQAVHIANPSLPMICASVSSPPWELCELGLVFADSLIVPFTLGQLRSAIELALHAQSGVVIANPRDSGSEF
jgi:hypothetical protein